MHVLFICRDTQIKCQKVFIVKRKRKKYIYIINITKYLINCSIPNKNKDKINNTAALKCVISVLLIRRNPEKRTHFTH